VAKIGKNWQKLNYFDYFEKVSFFTEECLGCVPRPEKRKNSHKEFDNLSMLANFDQF
jgi:hypothetical protein